MSTEHEWFEEAVSVVGDVIGFWGFKENHGKIWAMLYLRAHPMSTSEIRTHFGLSKGATSMLLHELEEWKVIVRTDHNSERERFFSANPNFIEMIVHVMEHRESDMIDQVMSRLTTVQQLAIDSKATAEQVQALKKMVELAEMVKQLVSIGRKLQSRNISELSMLLKTIDTLL